MRGSWLVVGVARCRAALSLCTGDIAVEGDALGWGIGNLDPMILLY